MSKRLIILFALAFVVSFSVQAFAELQDIKVGGDLTTLAVSRYGFNLAKPEDDASGIAAMTRVKFDANLTEDVMVTIRLLNERVWGSAEETAANNDIDLDLAYVTLKEFLYSPLTLKLGRQEFKLGNGLLVGDPDTNQVSAVGLPGTLGDLSLRKAFDGIVGMFDYNPTTVTLAYLKINEGTGTTTTSGLRANGDDVDLYVADVSYDFGVKNTVGALEYVLLERNKNDVSNVGVRLVSVPVDNLITSAEFVYQTTPKPTAEGKGHRSDYALALASNYSFTDVTWTPVLGIDFTRLTDNWNQMYEDATIADIVNALVPSSNCQVIGLSAIVKPMEDVTAKLRYANIRALEGLSILASNWGSGFFTMDASKEHIGDEFDLNFMYDYTEDVQLGLLLGFFDTGAAFTERENASQVVGSMKVTF